MLRLITTGPTADGGYPVDSDLGQMTDDGCPLSPDPTRWADPEWQDDQPPEPAVTRDNLGELDTFAAPADLPAPPPDSHWRRLQDRIELRGRWKAACDRMVRRSERDVGSGTGG